MATTGVKECPGSDTRQNSNTEDDMGVSQAERDGAEQTIEFNLSDPDQLSKQLEAADLTEEESDKLLNEAYKVNKKLKEMLRQQEARAKASQRTQSADSHASYKNKHPVLPPISKGGPGGIKSSKGGNQYYASSAAQYKPRNKSAKSKTTSQRADRPAWDDRFSYS